MSLFHVIILSIVEGITEFLPVSSTGHMILANSLLGVPETEFTKSFVIAIQGGTIFSVLFLYWRRFFTDFETIKRLIAAFIPTAIVGFIFYKLIKKFLLGNAIVVIVTLFLGGIILIVFEARHKEKSSDIKDISRIPYPKAVLIGLFQAIAVIPGVSRSAATIIGGLGLGIRRETMVEFSFLLAVPTLVAATVLDLLKSSCSFSGAEWTNLAIGSAISFIVATLSIKFFIAYVQRYNLAVFGVYRVLAAIACWYFV